MKARILLNRIKSKKKLFFLPSYCKQPPAIIQIEPTNICNLACPLCVNGKIENKDKKHLKLDEFRFIVDKLSTNSSIFLTKFGEPLLNPNIFEMIRYAKYKGHRVTISSNLFVNKNLLDEIVKSGLDSIVLSIDGISSETYSKYRVRSDFQTVYENMLILNEIKRKNKLSTLNIRWQFLVNKYNENEVKKATEIAKVNGLDIYFDNFGLTDDMPDSFSDDLKSLQEKWIPKESKFIRGYYNGSSAYNVKEGPCHFLWEAMSVNVNMKVTPCCYTYMEESYFGDLTDNSVMEIWNNENYRSARMLFNKSKKNYENKVICNHCNNFAKNHGKLFYLKNHIKEIASFALRKAL